MNREPITADELYRRFFPDTGPNELTVAEVIETTLQVRPRVSVKLTPV